MLNKSKVEIGGGDKYVLHAEQLGVRALSVKILYYGCMGDCIPQLL